MVEELERQTGDVKAGVEHKSEANVKNSPVHLHTVSSRQRFAIERKAARPLTLSLKLMTSKIFEGTVSEMYIWRLQWGGSLVFRGCSLEAQQRAVE